MDFILNASNPTRFAETARFYERLYPTEDGGVWVELFAEYEDPLRRFLVLDSTGRPVARLSFDRNLRPRTIWADSVLLTRRTESSNQELFLGRIIRPTTPPDAVPALRPGNP